MMRKVFAGLFAAMLSVGLLSGCGKNESAVIKESEPIVQEQEETVEEVVEENETQVTPAEAFAGGDGSKEDPYQISTLEELYRFAYVMDASNFEQGDEEYTVAFDKMHYVLTNDIVVNDVADFGQWTTNAPENVWKPVGVFRGTLEGMEHTITGLYCVVDKEDSLGNASFIGTLSGGEVANVNFEKAMMVGEATGGCAGILAGQVYDATIRNCEVEGTVIGSGMSQGGVVGSASWTMMDHCSFTGNVTSKENGVSGGLIGRASGCVIQDSQNVGTIESYGGNGNAAGGVVGSFSAASMGFLLDEEAYPEEKLASETTIADVRGLGVGVYYCANLGTVYSEGGVAGGVIGETGDGLGHEYRDPIAVIGCVNDGAVSSDGGAMSSAAGIVGWYATAPATVGEEMVEGALNVAECLNRGAVTSKAGNAAGVLGYASLDGGSLLFDACINEGAVSVSDEDAVIFVGSIAGGVSVFEGVELSFEDITDETAYQVKKNHITGGLVGGIVVAESEVGELKLTMKNCHGKGSFEAEEGATYGALCGRLLTGVSADDFQGSIDLKDCSCTDGVPAVGAAGSLWDAYVAIVSAVEE